MIVSMKVSISSKDKKNKEEKKYFIKKYFSYNVSKNAMSSTGIVSIEGGINIQ